MYAVSHQMHRHYVHGDDDRPQLPVRDNNMDSTCALAGSLEWAPDTQFKKVKQGNMAKSHRNADLKHYKPMPAKKVDGAVDTAEKGNAGSAKNANKAERIEEEPGSFASTNEANTIKEECQILAVEKAHKMATCIVNTCSRVVVSLSLVEIMLASILHSTNPYLLYLTVTERNHSARCSGSGKHHQQFICIRGKCRQKPTKS
jgi:hypothetical protein